MARKQRGRLWSCVSGGWVACRGRRNRRERAENGGADFTSLQMSTSQQVQTFGKKKTATAVALARVSYGTYETSGVGANEMS
jgi:hypothetical protein